MHSLTDEWGNHETLKIDSEEARYYRDVGIQMVKTGLNLYGEGDWANGWTLVEEDHEHGDRAFSIKTEKYGKVFAVESTLNVDIQAVLRLSWDRIEDVPKFNPTVLDYKILADISDRTRIINNSSQPVFGGLVSSRDFVDVNNWRKIGDAYCMAGRSVEYKGLPPQKGKIRGENLIGWQRISSCPNDSTSTQLCLMASADFKGMLPKNLTDRAMSHYLVEYVRNFKRHAESSLQ